jgi:hypothetical protein
MAYLPNAYTVAAASRRARGRAACSTRASSRSAKAASQVLL